MQMEQCSLRRASRQGTPSPAAPLVRRYFLASEEEACMRFLLTGVRRWLRAALAVLQTEELPTLEKMHPVSERRVTPASVKTA